MLLNGLIIILIPFLGTSLGSAVVLFSKGELNQKLQNFARICIGSNDCGINMVVVDSLN